MKITDPGGSKKMNKKTSVAEIQEIEKKKNSGGLIKIVSLPKDPGAIQTKDTNYLSKFII